MVFHALCHRAAACTPLQAITETSAWPWGERPAIDFNGLYFDRTDNGHSYYADTDATIHGPTTTAGTFESNCKVTSTGRMAARGSASAPEGLPTILETSHDFDQKSELHRGVVRRALLLGSSE